jgi:hypothetical protein
MSQMTCPSRYTRQKKGKVIYLTGNKIAKLLRKAAFPMDVIALSIMTEGTDDPDMHKYADKMD